MKSISDSHTVENPCSRNLFAKPGTSLRVSAGLLAYLYVSSFVPQDNILNDNRRRSGERDTDWPSLWSHKYAKAATSNLITQHASLRYHALAHNQTLSPTTPTSRGITLRYKQFLTWIYRRHVQHTPASASPLEKQIFVKTGSFLRKIDINRRGKLLALTGIFVHVFY